MSVSIDKVVLVPNCANSVRHIVVAMTSEMFLTSFNNAKMVYTLNIAVLILLHNI